LSTLSSTELQGNGHPALTQTAYEKHISCQDAIFATQEAIVHTLQEDRKRPLTLLNIAFFYDDYTRPASMGRLGSLSKPTMII